MQLTRLGVIVLLVLTVIASAITFPAIQAGREATRRRECESNVKRLVLGLQNYHDTFLYLPYGARNRSVPRDHDEPSWGSSWFLATIPFCEINRGYDAIYAASLADPANDYLSAPVRAGASDLGLKIKYMLCPSSPLPQIQMLSDRSLMVPSYAGIMGAAPFESLELAEGNTNQAVREVTGPYGGVAAGNGMLLINECLTMYACTDGTANCIVVGEVSDWYYTDRGQRHNPALSIGNAGDGANDAAGWLAGTNLGFPKRATHLDEPAWQQGQYVYSLEPPIPANSVCNLMTIRHAVGANNRLGTKDTVPDWGTHGVGRCGLNNPLLSAHPDGAMVGWMDAHVGLLTTQVSLEILQRLSIRDDGDAIDSGFPSDE